MARKPPKTPTARVRKAARLPSGLYGWKGRAVPFARLPKAERSRFQSLWATKGARTKARTEPLKQAGRDRKEAPERKPKRPAATPAEKRAAREWLRRRTVGLGIEEDPRFYTPNQIGAELSAKGILAARELQREAHAAYVAQGSRQGGHALEVADQIRQAIGAELASAMPQLWWYH